MSPLYVPPRPTPLSVPPRQNGNGNGAHPQPPPDAAGAAPTQRPPDAVLVLPLAPHPVAVAAESEALSADALALATSIAATPTPTAPPSYTDEGTVAWTVDTMRAVLAVLEPVERMEFLAAVEGRAERLETFREWIARVRPGYVFYRYSEVLIRVLQDVADGLRLRVMVFMPPQLGKSELVSRLFAAYYLYRYPERSVGLATYGADLSYALSRDARANYQEGGGELADDARSVKHWHTSVGGGLWAVGARGAAAGKGFSLGIVDDPLRDAEQAAGREREKRNEWYDSVFSQRKAAGAAIVILTTRWHMQDLAGFLLAREDVVAERWHVVRFASLAESRAPRAPVGGWGRAGRPAELDDPDRLPATCTEEPDWRQPGESVCEERKPRHDLEQIRKALGGEHGYFWNALHQQRPVPLAGGMFKRAMFQRIARTQCPPLFMLRLVRGWDFGASAASDADETYSVLLGRGLVGTPWAGRTLILGATHGRWEPAERDAQMRATMQADGVGVHQRAPQDPAQAGKTHAAHFASLCRDAGVPYSVVPVSGDKALNALPASADAGAGYYYLIDEPWAEDLLLQLTAFGPAAAHDDGVDALAIAHNFHAIRDRADRRAEPSRGGSVATGAGGGASMARQPNQAVDDALAYLHRRSAKDRSS